MAGPGPVSKTSRLGRLTVGEVLLGPDVLLDFEEEVIDLDTEEPTEVSGGVSPGFEYVEGKAGGAAQRVDSLELLPGTEPEVLFGCRTHRLEEPGIPRGETRAAGVESKAVASCPGLLPGDRGQDFRWVKWTYRAHEREGTQGQ